MSIGEPLHLHFGYRTSSTISQTRCLCACFQTCDVVVRLDVVALTGRRVWCLLLSSPVARGVPVNVLLKGG